MQLGKTIEMFGLNVDQKSTRLTVLPENSAEQVIQEDDLSKINIIKAVLGPVKATSFKNEEGNEMLIEKSNDHRRAYRRYEWAPFVPSDEESECTSNFGSVKSEANERDADLANTVNKVIMANKDAEKHKIVRQELDKIMKMLAEKVPNLNNQLNVGTNVANRFCMDTSSTASHATRRTISTWGNFTETPTRNWLTPIENYIRNYEELDLEEKISALKNELPAFDPLDIKYQDIKYALQDDDAPPVDAREIADLMTYYEIYAKHEQPEWRKELIKMHGPAGVSIEGYNDYHSAAIWEWDTRELDDWVVDSKRELKYDGEKFWEKQADGTRVQVPLENWLIDRVKKKNPSALNGKWKYRELYFELILTLEVSARFY